VETAIINDLQISPRERNEPWQQKAKVLKNGKFDPTDDGGHIFRAQWGGPSEQINYFPQSPNENQSPGTWYNMEEAISNLKETTAQNEEIKIVMKFNYEGTARPSSIDVEVKVGQNINTQLTKRYDNP